MICDLHMRVLGAWIVFTYWYAGIGFTFGRRPAGRAVGKAEARKRSSPIRAAIPDAEGGRKDWRAARAPWCRSRAAAGKGGFAASGRENCDPAQMPPCQARPCPALLFAASGIRPEKFGSGNPHRGRVGRGRENGKGRPGRAEREGGLRGGS